MDERRLGWRPLLVVAGVLLFVGGGMHPESSEDGLSLKEDLASMMADDAWVPGHTIMAIGAASLLGGVVLVRRGRGWPLPDRVLRVAVVATAANVLELILHTAAVVDEEALADGDLPLVAGAHVVASVAFYPLFGLTVAYLAWRLAGASWSPLRVFSAVGVVGGLCHAVSAPLVYLMLTATLAEHATVAWRHRGWRRDEGGLRVALVRVGATACR